MFLQVFGKTTLGSITGHEGSHLHVHFASWWLIATFYTAAVQFLDIGLHEQAVVRYRRGHGSLLLQVIVENGQVAQRYCKPDHLAQTHLAFIRTIGVGSCLH